MCTVLAKKFTSKIIQRKRKKKQHSKNKIDPKIVLPQKKGHNIQKDKLEFEV